MVIARSGDDISSIPILLAEEVPEDRSECQTSFTWDSGTENIGQLDGFFLASVFMTALKRVVKPRYGVSEINTSPHP